MDPAVTVPINNEDLYQCLFFFFFFLVLHFLLPTVAASAGKRCVEGQHSAAWLFPLRRQACFPLPFLLLTRACVTAEGPHGAEGRAGSSLHICWKRSGPTQFLSTLLCPHFSFILRIKSVS